MFFLFFSGDVSEFEIIGEATGTVTEDTKGIPDGTMIQVQIENGLSPLINANSIDTTKVRVKQKIKFSYLIQVEKYKNEKIYLLDKFGN